MNYSGTMDRRMFDFEDFYKQVADKLPDHCRIAEVGIADGASAIFLAECLRQMNKPFKMVLVDDFSYGGHNQMAEVMKHLLKSGMGDDVTIFPYDSLKASCMFPDHYFHFVFIDASHEYEPTKADIRLWWRKVIDGGVLAGHDFLTCPGTQKAVKEVVPDEMIRVTPTAKSYGIWCVDKIPNKELL